MANFKELVAAFEGGEKPRLADSSSYKPEIDVIIQFLGSQGALQANIDGSHRREAKRMVKENYPEIYKANKGIHLTADKMYIGLSPEVCRYMSMKLNEAGHTIVGDTSMHKLLLDEPALAKQSDSADLPVGQIYLVVGLLIQGEHNVTPSLYELVDDIKHAGDNDPMAVTHTNAGWLAMIETWRWGDMTSADCLTPLPVREHIAATNTNIKSEAYRIKNQMPDLAEELPVMPKGEEVDKDDKVWLNTELCKTCIVEGDFKAPATKQAVADAMFSTYIMLGHFKDTAKLKDENRQTVSKYQKPIALFAKHLKMAATDGTTIVDVTAGTGTTAVHEGCNPGE
eukprot:jgi/Tetstr1/424532/TSEL_015060.t1